LIQEINLCKNSSFKKMPLSTLDILKRYWGFDSFRPLQEAVIEKVLEKKDVFVSLPTSGGKSICFQVPTMLSGGLCLVISPLLALMKDQVEGLRKKGITAFALHSGMNRKQVMNLLRVAGESNCRFLYLSPERLESMVFKEYLPSLNISLIAVDEAHCISQWGYDFRPPYLRIAALREELPGVPVIALTASATKEVQADICEKLLFKERSIFHQSFTRPNLSYSTFTVDSKIDKIRAILDKVPGSSIIYCKSRRSTHQIAEELNMAGIHAESYHAGLTAQERNDRQEAWIKDELRVMVSTNAFGMGIDKPDVRTVIHADLPDSLEYYYQEAGRAGRDENRSYAILLSTAREPEALKGLPDIHFPSFENIFLVYQAVMNFLQVAAGTGAGNYYDFDFSDFVNKFKLKRIDALYSLKALEQEGLLSVHEQVYIPSQVAFAVNKSALYDFENQHPSMEPLVKILLRTYPGILDQSVSIQEKSIAYLQKQDIAEVATGLKQLHGLGIIEYAAQKDSPQLYLIQNRVRSEDFRFDQASYALRKRRYASRVETMVNYAREKYQCRSVFISNYFGDQDAKNCGLCDNCLNQKKERSAARSNPLLE
jgi:ATP-dependent DNA helicase RecQ